VIVEPDIAKPRLAAGKLRAIAAAHEALNRVGGSGQAFALPFLSALVAAFTGSRQRIHIACDAALQLPVTELAPIGMIASEAISNALKHAFPAERDGDIWVRLSEVDGRVTLRIRDNGVGMPDLDHARDSGRGRMEAFAQQLGGYARLGSVPFGGAEVLVVFHHSS
jgi:two-component sensor histidine kinase